MPLPKEPRMVAHSEQGLVLVEYVDGEVVRRAWLPEGVPVTVDECRRGLPYGVQGCDLQVLLESALPSLSRNLETALHRRRLYTAADVESIPEVGREVEAAWCEAGKAMAALLVEFLRQEV